MKKILLIASILILFGCKSASNPCVTVNNYRQTNYSTQSCYDGTKTFSQIIVCLQEVDAKEKNQNNITNEMLDKIA
jgi:hypothetical protein